MKAQVGVIGGVLPGFVTGIYKDSVRRWNLWFPSAGVFAKVLAGRATGTQITFPQLVNWEDATGGAVGIKSWGETLGFLSLTASGYL